MTKLSEILAGAVPSWGAKVAYGEKVTLNGADFVPVALVGFGFGAGEGSGETQEGTQVPAGHGEGSGGGGGGFSVPLGAYIGAPGGPTFHANPIPLLVVLAPVVTAIGFSVAAILAAKNVRSLR